jgi:hypothetical protein
MRAYYFRNGEPLTVAGVRRIASAAADRLGVAAAPSAAQEHHSGFSSNS